MLRYFSLHIIYPSKLKVLFELHSRRTARSSEQVISKDKYLRVHVFPRQMEAFFNLSSAHRRVIEVAQVRYISCKITFKLNETEK